jgi:hypothetical protein
MSSVSSSRVLQSIANSLLKDDEDGRPESQSTTVRSRTGCEYLALNSVPLGVDAFADVVSSSSFSLLFAASAADLLGMWYPTVRRTLVCLSKLYRSLDKTTFEGLSQDALSACVVSLVGAAEQVRQTKSTVSCPLSFLSDLHLR